MLFIKISLVYLTDKVRGICVGDVLPATLIGLSSAATEKSARKPNHRSVFTSARVYRTRRLAEIK